MAGIKTTVKVPELDQDNIQMYLDKLSIWAIVTDVEKKIRSVSLDGIV